MATFRKKKSGAEAEIEEQQQMRLIRKLKRAKQKKEREMEGEVDSLNLIPMMDMMTILLVFLIKSYSASGISMSASGDIEMPISSTTEQPKETVSVTVTRCAPSPKKTCRPGEGTVFVNDKLVLVYENDKIPASKKEGGNDSGLLILPLRSALENEVEKSKKIASWNAAAPFTGELSVIADKQMPYRMLTEILYTAGQAELDKYRFVVIQDGGDS